MSKHDIQQMLQHCLEGYDAGLTPEECLSAYPRSRRELEPLLRQALALRFAFAAKPREEFRLATREKLLFAAGSEVSQALSAEPDPHFVNQARRRFLNAAGATAQEALRDVPPPRLPFWANARRHLLEAATVSPPRHGAGSLAFGLRSAISAAVVVIAVAVAGAGFFLQGTPANRDSTASAQLASLERDLSEIDSMRAQGQAVSPSLLDDLAKRTSLLVDQLDEEPELKEKLPGLIDRQQSVVKEVIDSGRGAQLAQAQEQLSAAEEKVSVVTALSGSPEASATSAGAIVGGTQTPGITATPTVQPTGTPEATPDPDEPKPEGHRILIQLDPTDTTQGLSWTGITTERLDMVIESSWVPDFDIDDDGFAVLRTSLMLIFLDDSKADVMVVSIETGEVVLSQDGVQTQLRAPGPDGAIIDATTLVELRRDDYAAVFHSLTSITVKPSATETPDESPTETP